MAYIGKQPTIGNFVKLDTITTSATATYNLTNGGVAFSPQSPNHCIVSLNGVIQSPTSAYTISGSTIVFSDALTASDVIDFILVLGDVLNIGTPSDNTVSLAKLTATGTKDATTFLRGDNTFAAPSNTVKQIITSTDNTTYAVSVSGGSGSASSQASTVTFGTITPTSASSKIICHWTVPQIDTNSDVHGGLYLNIWRSINAGAYTQLSLGGTSAGSRHAPYMSNYNLDGDGNRALGSGFSGVFVDEPSTTSSVQYKLYVGMGDNTSYTIYVNRTYNDADDVYTGRTKTHSVLMEI